MKKSVGITILLALSMVLSSAAFSQETARKMRQEIVKLKYIDREDIRIVLSTFLSPYGRISPTEKSGLLTISDIPENVEKILAVIRELDVKPADIQFTIQLVLASTEDDPGKSEELSKDDPLIKELRNLLNFKFFYALDSSLVRAIDREDSEVTMGSQAELRLQLRPKYIREEKEELIQVEARLSKILLTGPDLAKNLNSLTLLTSNFTMRSGEKTVVGVSKLDGGDKGLILIITGKIVR
jgi:type II secretory pathway component GspD/PulD (secretin)